MRTCNAESQKRQQKDPILKKATGFCPSVIGNLLGCLHPPSTTLLSQNPTRCFRTGTPLGMSALSFYFTLVSESYSLFPYRYRYSFGNVCTLLLLNSCLRILLAVSVPVLLFHCLGTLFVLSLYSLFTLFVLSLYCRCTIVYYLRTSDICTVFSLYYHCTGTL